MDLRERLAKYHPLPSVLPAPEPSRLLSPSLQPGTLGPALPGSQQRAGQRGLGAKACRGVDKTSGLALEQIPEKGEVVGGPVVCSNGGAIPPSPALELGVTQQEVPPKGILQFWLFSTCVVKIFPPAFFP